MTTPTWWAISGEQFMKALQEVEAGALAEDVYIEWYANADITDVSGGD